MSSANATQTASTTAATPSPPLAVADAQFYTWTTFFRLLSGQGTTEEREKYFRTRDVINEEADCKRCDERKVWLLQHSPIIKFLRQQIHTLSPTADINSENVRCRRCTTPQQGGFDSNYGILLCANNLRSRSNVEDALAHEMVHAYDHLRFQVDPNNMRHQACTEIRASMLSGECRFTREFFSRGQWKLTSQMQECVRRRAVRSMMARPSIAGDEEKAQKEVDAVWDSCFSDTRPFDEIYR